MTTVTVLVMIALIVTIGTLVMGVASMAHGGEYDHRHSHHLMSVRVGVQAIALLILAVAILLAAR